MLWAACLTAFFGFLQCSEMQALLRGQGPDDDHQAIRALKTDHGASIRIYLTRPTALCVCGDSAGPPAGRLHRQDWAHLQQGATHEAKAQRADTFQIGAASIRMGAGIPDWKIQTVGITCHISDSRVSYQ